MIYIHIPYCHHKCTYCGFYSLAGHRDLQPYIDALCKEIAHRSEPSRKVKTIYFGGGTPSLLPENQLAQIWNTLQHHFDLSSLEEATLEANPEDLTPYFLNSIAHIGFNRLSIGIQSFSDSDLHTLNRVHNSQQAIDAIHNAHRAGFNNLSIDLIYGLPNQSNNQWLANLQQIESLDVQHLSCYALTLEENSILAKQIAMGRILPSSDETIADHYDLLCQWAEKNGFQQYEISNFCRPGFHSRHNSRYWDRTPYLGFGAAAHSFDGEHRRWNLSDAEKYIAQGALFEEESLSKTDAFNEYVMTALRTVQGIQKELVEPQFMSHLSQSINRFLSAGLIVETETAYRPTKEGLFHADGMAADLFL